MNKRDRGIVRRYEAGDPVGDIARDAGVSQSMVTKVVRRAGVPLRFPNLTAEQWREAAGRAKAGESYKDIASDMGISAGTASRIGVEVGIKRQDWPPEVLLDLLRWLALRLGRTPSAREFHPPDMPCWWGAFQYHFSGWRVACRKAGLVPNGHARDIKELPAGFREKHGHLRRYRTAHEAAEALLKSCRRRSTEGAVPNPTPDNP